MIRIAIAGLITFASINSAQAQTAPSPDALFERGKALVKENCTQCHAIEAKGKSSHAEAPPFRELLKRYPIDALEEGFADRIYSTHPDMPVFKVNPEQLDTILYYIASIQAD